MQTDEDRQIERLLIHRNLVGWVIERLGEVGIDAMRTSGNDENGDIRLTMVRTDLEGQRAVVEQVFVVGMGFNQGRVKFY